MIQDYFEKFKRWYLFNTEKIKYVGKKSDKHTCILCAIRDKAEDVVNLEVYRTNRFIVSINLYPFNPGHCMIFPLRHCENIHELDKEDIVALHELTIKAIDIIKEEFNPSGFNVGFNIGLWSGASISHIHLHIVPRFPNELGFLDVISHTRVMVVDPLVVCANLKKRFHSHE